MRQDNGKTEDPRRGCFSEEEEEEDFIHMDFEVLLQYLVEDLQ